MDFRTKGHGCIGSPQGPVGRETEEFAGAGICFLVGRPKHIGRVLEFPAQAGHDLDLRVELCARGGRIGLAARLLGLRLDIGVERDGEVRDELPRQPPNGNTLSGSPNSVAELGGCGGAGEPGA